LLNRTVDEARGKWRGIITTFGIDPKFLDGKHQKCPFCGGKDRFRFDDKDGTGSYFCSGCKPGLGMDLVMNSRGWDFARAAREVDAIIGHVRAVEPKPDRTEKDKVNALRRLLECSGRVIQGSASWDYLNRRCGHPGAILGDLRHHAGLKHSTSGKTFPALLAILRYPDGSGACVHRTFLSPEGTKAPIDPVRMIMPAPLPLAGSAIRLGLGAERLGIAEGLETAVCAGKLFGLPVWSAISANGMKEWQPPEGVRSVVIFGDNDLSLTGQEAAFDLGKKLRLKGIDVEVQIPGAPGTDWADVWKDQQNPGAA